MDDVAAVRDANGVRSAILIGVSDGARRGLGFAHRYPERVDHLVAIGGAFGEFPDPSPEESAAREVMRDHFVRRAGVHKSEGIHAAAEADIRAWGAVLDGDPLRKMIGLQVANSYWIDLPDEDYLGRELDPPVKSRFAEISTPISVVVGGHDFEATRLWARRIVDQAPHATLTLLPDADHFPMLSAPGEFERIVREVLS
jgi:pimeloyl-ACP methyl ester carboxylesterase